jgi:hypothetical protein
MDSAAAAVRKVTSMMSSPPFSKASARGSAVLRIVEDNHRDDPLGMNAIEHGTG